MSPSAASATVVYLSFKLQSLLLFPGHCLVEIFNLHLLLNLKLLKFLFMLKDLLQFLLPLTMILVLYLLIVLLFFLHSFGFDFFLFLSHLQKTDSVLLNSLFIFLLNLGLDGRLELLVFQL